MISELILVLGGFGSGAAMSFVLCLAYFSNQERKIYEHGRKAGIIEGREQNRNARAFPRYTLIPGGRE